MQLCRVVVFEELAAQIVAVGDRPVVGGSPHRVFSDFVVRPFALVQDVRNLLDDEERRIAVLHTFEFGAEFFNYLSVGIDIPNALQDRVHEAVELLGLGIVDEFEADDILVELARKDIQLRL